MAGDSGLRIFKMAMEISHVLVVVNLFNFISVCVATVESHGQAFIQTDNELRYMVDGQIDGVPSHILPCHSLQDSLQDGLSRPSSPIRFDPPLLDFHEQPVGMPFMEQVTVHNPDPQNSLHLLSISGSTVHFHCSFFQDKMVPPGGNTTFDVVFLAREEGNIENTLYIHTSQSYFKYQVFGVGVANPYRIRPFIGAKVPVNSSFSPLIQMHNPHSSTLQVVEMYSSGGDLHLELPTGEKEAPKNLWEIPPYETRPVMRASFVGRIESNHTAFIRIKTNREKKDEVLILPVEVEVTSSPGLFSPLEMLDFGIMRTLDGPKTLRLNLLNSGSKPLHISSITVSPPNDAISIEFRPTKLQPDVLQTTPVALISYTASKAVHPRQWTGKIVVKSKTGQYKIAIPYQANVLHGSLVYDQNATMFYTGQMPARNETRNITLTNTFNFTLVVYNASLPSDTAPYFSIVNFTGPVMIEAQQVLSPLQLKFTPSSPNMHLITELRIATNASTFNIPIVVYNGRLKVVHHRPEIFKGQLDFGTMGVEERRNMTFTLRNDNPIDIVIREFSANMEHTCVELLGIEKGNGTTLTRKHNVSEIDTNPLVLRPYHFAVFSVSLVAPSWEGTFAAEVIIVSQHENLYIPITLRTAEGSLQAVPEKINFEECFPSKICYQELRINSSFEHIMEIRDITFQPKDIRFYYSSSQSDGPVRLQPHSQTNIGRIYFDSKRECKDDCFLGLPTCIPAGHQWLLGASLDKEVADTDQYLYTRFQQKWDLLGHQQLSTINVTIQLDTNQVRGFLFPAQAHLHWPSLTQRSKIRFPLTQIGNLTIREFKIQNPSDTPVLMQLLPLPLYPNPQTIVDMLTPSFSHDLSDYIEMDDLDIFTLPGLDTSSTIQDPISKLRSHVEETLGVQPHKQTVTMLLGTDGSEIRVRVGFQPKDDLARTSLIVIRNNLTIIDAIVVQGQGGRGEMRFSNRKPGSTTPLQFEITADKHLKACEKKKQSKTLSPSFTVKRTFTARNTGQLPFYVHGFSINDVACEGYGFRVLECEGFELLPNASRKVDIAFTPDFTMSRMRRTLSIHTSLGPAVNYTLQATVPASMLTKCAAALPRPPWEPIMYYIVICLMAFVLFCVLVGAYFESDRVFTADLIRCRAKVSSATQTFDKSKVFDLKVIAGIRPPVDSSSKHSLPKTPPVDETPTTDIPNGYPVDPPPKKQSFSLLTFLWRFLFTTRKSSRSKSPKSQSPMAEPVETLEKESQPQNINAANNIHATNKQDPVPAVIEKTPLLLKLPSNKRTKAAKRHNTDNADQAYVINYIANNGMHEKKYGHPESMAPSTTVPSNLGPRTEMLSDITTTTTTTNLKNMRNKHDGHVNNLLDNGLDPELTLITDSSDDQTKNGKHPRSRQGRSNRHQTSNDLFDRHVKDRLRSIDLGSDQDKDDASSTTTTDSSSAEHEDKTSSARDSTPEPVQQPAKKKAKVKKDKKNRSGQDEEEVANDDDFVITSKYKAHHKIKVDPKSAYGGNIHCPSSIELPYKTKLEADREILEFSVDAPSGSDKSKKGSKNNRNAKPKAGEAAGMVTSSNTAGLSDFGVDISTRPSAGSTGSLSPTSLSSLAASMPSTFWEWPPSSARSSSDSNQPVWDMPPKLPRDPEGDLSELASQTEVFAARVGRNTSNLGIRGMSPDPLTPDLLTSSSRSSSYSSVVSNGGAISPVMDGSGRMKTFKTNETGKKSAYVAPAASCGLGGKSNGASSKPAGSINPLRNKSPWGASGVPGSPNTPDPLGAAGYGLQPIAELQSGVSLTDDDILQSYTTTSSANTQSPFAAAVPNTIGQFSPLGGASSYDMQPVTMMQRLQAERRKRLMDYQHKLLGEEWPGFNIGLPQQSLWDASMPPPDPWATIPGSSSQTTASSTQHTQVPPASLLWENPLTNPSSATWTTPTSAIWTDTTTDATAAGDLSPQPQGAAVGGFDPFNTLGSIWNPAGPSAASAGWSFVPPKPDDAEN